MSISLMSAAWKFSGLSPGAKLVLLALCDNASDEGACFPSIRTLALKCSMAERTVQGHIAAFEADGLLTRVERPGRSTVYTLNPRRFCTPADSAPPQNLHPTPAVSAPPPPQFLHPTPAVSAPITIKEPSSEPSGNQKRAQRERSAPPSTPEDVSPQVWSDWLKLRQAKKAPVTDTVIHGARAEAIKAGMTFTEFLTEWCNRGSQGLKAEWLTQSRPASAESFRERDARIAAEQVKRLTGGLVHDRAALGEAPKRAPLPFERGYVAPAADIIEGAADVRRIR